MRDYKIHELKTVLIEQAIKILMKLLMCFGGYLCIRLENDQLYRTIGISFGKFIPNKIKQLSLFDDPLKIKTEII
ncbi:hypothetical protein [Mammaliicoccus sp. E-M22]|uniref:hypothetical protein n=2 Tax=unclassified Mammaliicoccus TaxID=2803851 RepID=UPI001EFA9C53|nr:hypothetical protein [Mammaliicoccus sp. E-M22]